VKFIDKVAKNYYPTATIFAVEIKQDGPPAGQNIEITLYGDYTNDLKTAAAQAEKLLKKMMI
jgi:hypothetical protein